VNDAWLLVAPTVHLITLGATTVDVDEEVQPTAASTSHPLSSTRTPLSTIRTRWSAQQSSCHGDLGIADSQLLIADFS
jgi:hypothetical protein